MTGMMVSIMRCCINRRDWHKALVALLLGCCVSFASAGGIAVGKTELRLEDQDIQPVADFVLTPNPLIEQALAYGVPLYFVSEFTLVHPRWYWLNETIAQDTQTIRLSYNALTRQYRIAYGSLYQNFASLDDALHALNHRYFTSFKASLLKPNTKYLVSVRLHLDGSQLPKPLQINALVNTDWELNSGWYQWEATTAALKRTSDNDDEDID